MLKEVIYFRYIYSLIALNLLLILFSQPLNSHLFFSALKKETKVPGVIFSAR